MSQSPVATPLVAPRTRERMHSGKSYSVSEAHPVADFYQWITDDQLTTLAASIRKRGLEKPIHRLRDGRIIDGRNRELACLVAGIEPRYETRAFATEVEIVAHIRAANEYRRHGSPSQRAMTAARLVNLRRGTNQHARKADGAQAPSIPQNEVAGQFDVSRDLIKRARAVLRRGVAGLAAVVDDDRLDVTTAARLAKLGVNVQRAVVAATDPKAAACRAFQKSHTPLAPSVFSPLVPDGKSFIRITPEAVTVGSTKLADGTTLPGIPKRLADGRVWLGWYIDIQRGMRTAYLIPSLRNGGWFVAVMNVGTDEWHTHKYPLKPYAAMDILTNPERFDFDVHAAHWQPTEGFAPSGINPLYLDPDYAPTLSPELKQSVEDEVRLEEKRKTGATNAPEEIDYPYADSEY